MALKNGLHNISRTYALLLPTLPPFRPLHHDVWNLNVIHSCHVFLPSRHAKGTGSETSATEWGCRTLSLTTRNSELPTPSQSSRHIPMPIRGVFRISIPKMTCRRPSDNGATTANNPAFPVQRGKTIRYMPLLAHQVRRHS